MSDRRARVAAALSREETFDPETSGEDPENPSMRWLRDRARWRHEKQIRRGGSR
jgi:hypothetical protein